MGQTASDAFFWDVATPFLADDNITKSTILIFVRGKEPYVQRN